MALYKRLRPLCSRIVEAPVRVTAGREIRLLTRVWLAFDNTKMRFTTLVGGT